VLNAGLIRERILSVLNSWLAEEGCRPSSRSAAKT
jgi:hypothetical protein